jgi:hypothetical protein
LFAGVNPKVVADSTKLASSVVSQIKNPFSHIELTKRTTSRTVLPPNDDLRRDAVRIARVDECAYLRQMLDVVLFPEIWRLRTDL